MIESYIHGGLGNQMFQYALGLSIAKRNNIDYCINLDKMVDYQLREFTLEKFNISAKICQGNRESLKKYVRYIEWVEKKASFFGVYLGNKYYEKKEYVYDAQVFKTKKKIFSGYWQSFKYFDSIRTEVLKEFSLKGNYHEDNFEILKKIRSVENSVSLHIRRGDYLSAKNSEKYNIIKFDYYTKALDLIKSNVKDFHVFVFSDDIDWAIQNLNLKHKVTYSSLKHVNKPEEELMLMSKCNHNIIVNSTFSWWAAWLNENKDKIVVAPEFWVKDVKSNKDLIPDSWVVL